MNKIIKITVYIISLLTTIVFVMAVIFVVDNINSYKTPSWVSEKAIKDKNIDLFSDVEEIIATNSEVSRNSLIDKLNEKLSKNPGSLHSIAFENKVKPSKGMTLVPGFASGIYKTYAEKLSFVDYGDAKFERLKGFSINDITYDLLRYKLAVNKPYISSVTFEFYLDKLK